MPSAPETSGAPVPAVPAGFTPVTPYLVLRKVPPVIAFLEQAFGAKEEHRTTLPDGRVMHAVVRVGGAPLMMGEARDDWPPMPAMVHLYVPDAQAAYDRAIAAGATSLQAPSTTFYGHLAGGVQDAQGNVWWIATQVELVSEEEADRRLAGEGRATHG